MWDVRSRGGKQVSPVHAAGDTAGTRGEAQEKSDTEKSLQEKGKEIGCCDYQFDGRGLTTLARFVV
jgi:hypothetical protein